MTHTYKKANIIVVFVEILLRAELLCTEDSILEKLILKPIFQILYQMQAGWTSGMTEESSAVGMATHQLALSVASVRFAFLTIGAVTLVASVMFLVAFCRDRPCRAVTSPTAVMMQQAALTRKTATAEDETGGRVDVTASDDESPTGAEYDREAGPRLKRCAKARLLQYLTLILPTGVRSDPRQINV